MRRLPVLLSIALVGALPLTAPAQAKPATVKHGYVVSRFLVPTSGAQAIKVGFDLDGDRVVDNRIGQLFGFLAGEGLDLQAAADEAVSRGAVVSLVSIRTTSLKNDDAVKVRLLRGKPVEDPDFTAGTFAVDGDAPKSVLKGRIAGGVLLTKPGKLRLTLPSLYPGLPSISLDLAKARLAAKCTATRCRKGKLGGGISVVQINLRVVPAIGAIARAAIAADCTGATESTCADGSNGQTMMQYLDADNDGTVTNEEVRTNLLVKSALAPDVDLDGDGKKDAVSIGVGFRAVFADVKGD